MEWLLWRWACLRSGFGPGEEEMAHAVNERVAIRHLVKAAQFYAAFPLTYVESKRRAVGCRWRVRDGAAHSASGVGISRQFHAERYVSPQQNPPQVKEFVAVFSSIEGPDTASWYFVISGHIFKANLSYWSGDPSQGHYRSVLTRIIQELKRAPGPDVRLNMEPLMTGAHREVGGAWSARAALEVATASLLPLPNL